MVRAQECLEFECKAALIVAKKEQKCLRRTSEPTVTSTPINMHLFALSLRCTLKSVE